MEGGGKKKNNVCWSVIKKFMKGFVEFEVLGFHVLEGLNLGGIEIWEGVGVVRTQGK